MSLVGSPIAKWLRSLKIGRWNIPDWLAAASVILLFLAIITLGLSLFAPLVAQQAEAFANIDAQKVFEGLGGNTEIALLWLERTDLSGTELSNREFLLQEMHQQMAFDKIAGALGSIMGIFGLIGNAAIALFSIVFITFFLLKDTDLIVRVIYSLTPDKYIDQIQDIIRNTHQLLRRYFTGLIIQISIVTICISTGLWLIGIDNAFLIGFLAGIINLIPYIGPLIGAAIGIIIAVTSHLYAGHFESLLPLTLKTSLVFLLVQLLDNIVLQPVIFSRSVKAHPLEIFIVISVAGTLGGIAGMIIAIPAYTLARVIAREFLGGFKSVDHLTRGISD
jgi:predicted PurR-regulated permease PerM